MQAQMLAGRTAIVMGGSGNIGSSIARNLAAHGARVAINYLHNKKSAFSLIDEIESGGGIAMALEADITAPESVRGLVDITYHEYGSVDILINSAGIVRDKLMLSMIDADWDEVIEVNLSGPLNACLAAVPYMKKQSYGRIVNIGSITGLAAQKMRTNYGAAKRGLVGLTKCLARELAQCNIRVNVVTPQVVRGGVSRSASIIELRQLAKFTPVGGIAEPHNVADAVLFLACDDIEFLTGATINLTGGLITWQV